MAKERKLTRLSELGEFNLIDHLTGDVTHKNKSTHFGIGDDAAVLDYGNNYSLVTNDVFLEGVHFNLMYFPLQHLGYKSVVANLSDIYAMNGNPRQIVVSLALSSKFSMEAVDELYKGVKRACEYYNVDLVGGDITSSLTGLAISITAIGEVEKSKVVYRSTAQPNDVIVVTGDVGGAYMGMQLLEREKEVFKASQNAQPELEGYDYILGRQLKPEARGDVINALDNAGVIPTSMIDISDGLASEIIHITNDSQAGCKLFESKIPIHDKTREIAKEMNYETTIAALHGGDDYELMFTVSLNDYEHIKDIEGLNAVGHILSDAEEVNLVSDDGATVPIRAQGWNTADQEE